MRLSGNSLALYSGWFGGQSQNSLIHQATGLTYSIPATIGIYQLGSSINCFINGALIFTSTDSTYTSGYFGVQAAAQTEWFTNIYLDPAVPAATGTPTSTITQTLTASPTPVYSNTPSSANVFAAQTGTWTTNSNCISGCFTPNTFTSTFTPSQTFSASPTFTQSSTASPNSTATPVNQYCPSCATATPIQFPTVATATPPPTPLSPFPTVQLAQIITPTITQTPTISTTWTNSPSFTASPSLTPTYTPTATFTAAPTLIAGAYPAPTPGIGTN
ncbi:hypothetical protein KGP36_02250, partial [Patescibacteria group bacterium]|nr:hypothetical protein [Patescibacteria group bacterium]